METALWNKAVFHLASKLYYKCSNNTQRMVFQLLFQKTRDFMAKLGLPQSDSHDLPTSGQTLPGRVSLPPGSADSELGRSPESALETAESQGIYQPR